MITPIITLGGIAFSHFVTGDNGEIIEVKSNKTRLPEKPMYIFTDLNADIPYPKYCEQPLIHIVKFAMEVNKLITEKDLKDDTWDSVFGLAGLGLLWAFSFPVALAAWGAGAFFSSMREDGLKKKLKLYQDKLILLSRNMKINGDGYKIVK